ncbi:serine/threonine protein kinase [Dictyobacter aurantiacus]|uniref:non-specific serine/threonine protein kinase n=1 Tax=Dictyobacter aurantiacus TaxID=1936993 RepID=A0A401ZB54_9CHLR|nr:serine/threonine-protein kinase [Dictyobacter aurantiacus]GCE04089.1 hypothetical protein KDAU_14180 [Dictyobacter aurantiacus]
MDTNQHYLGPYELQQRLSDTRQYESWKAWDPQHQRQVEITMLHLQAGNAAALMSRFVYETKNLTTLNHPSIAKIYDVQASAAPQRPDLPGEVAQPQAYIVREYIEGMSLADYIEATARVGDFPAPTDIYRILAPASSALDYAHQHGVIHSHLKPAHILFTQSDSPESPQGEIKVVGFGMHNMLSPLTLALEDAAYISPEGAQGQTVNTRSDIYSLGVILYELCTGTLPFQGETTSEMLMQHMHAEPMSPALINTRMVPGMTAIILRCLAKDPSARFPTGAALTAALSRVANAPGKSRVGQSGAASSGNRLTPWFTPAQVSIDETYLSPQRSQGLTGSAASNVDAGANVSGAYPIADVPTSLSSAPTSAAPAVTPDGGHTPTHADAVMHSPRSAPDLLAAMETQRLHPVSPASQPAPPVSPPHVAPYPVRRDGFWRTSRGKKLTILLSALLCLAVIGASLVAFFASRYNGLAASSPSGHAFFVSSGLLDPGNPKGIVDGLQIDLTGVPVPDSGKSYYAWLLGDTDTNVTVPPIALGSLSLVSGHASMAYSSPQNDNLLSHYSRFLVTEEDAAAPPTNPSLDPATWRYGAVFSRVPSPEDTQNHFSLLDHLRHLLAQDPKLAKVGLTGGLDIWLFRNSLKVLEWTGSARDAYNSGDTGLMQRQAVRILDYLDGTQYVQTENIPSTLSPILVDPKIARVALLEVSQSEEPPGYLKHIGNHLREITNSPNVSVSQKQLAREINLAIDNVQAWYLGVHDDAAKLIHMSPAQLRQPGTLDTLNHMFKLANNAFVGETDPGTNKVKEGVSQIHYKAQRLATFDIVACSNQTNQSCV